jgi:hypothetical protein
MPRYRINYLGRTEERPGSNPGGDQQLRVNAVARMSFGTQRFYETEFQDEIEGISPAAALDAFFWQHTDRRGDVMIKASSGRGQPIEGLADYDPGTVYIWIEDNWFMEYQGIEELRSGKAPCPMCNGDGEIDESLVDFYEEMAGRKSASA